MPLDVLGPLVAGGILLVVLAVHLTGGSRPARLATAEDAARRFALDAPACPVVAVQLARDGAGAVLACADGTVGILVPVGADWLTRRWGPGHGRGAGVVAEGFCGLRIIAGEPGFPGARLVFETPEGRDEALHWLGGVKAVPAGPATMA